MGKGWCILDNLLEESKLGVAAVRRSRIHSFKSFRSKGLRSIRLRTECDLYHCAVGLHVQGVHTYLKHENATDPASPVESQLPHIAAFMLAQTENWYVLVW